MRIGCLEGDKSRGSLINIININEGATGFITLQAININECVIRYINIYDFLVSFTRHRNTATITCCEVSGCERITNCGPPEEVSKEQRV